MKFTFTNKETEYYLKYAEEPSIPSKFSKYRGLVNTIKTQMNAHPHNTVSINIESKAQLSIIADSIFNECCPKGCKYVTDPTPDCRIGYQLWEKTKMTKENPKIPW